MRLQYVKCTNMSNACQVSIGTISNFNNFPIHLIYARVYVNKWNVVLVVVDDNDDDDDKIYKDKNKKG